MLKPFGNREVIEFVPTVHYALVVNLILKPIFVGDSIAAVLIRRQICSPFPVVINVVGVDAFEFAVRKVIEMHSQTLFVGRSRNIRPWVLALAPSILLNNL